VPCFIIWEFDESHPAFNIRVFAHRNFTIGVICLTAGFFSIQGLFSMFIVQLQVLLGYSSFLAGMVYLPMILLAVPVAVLMHKLPKGLDARLLACLNLLGFAATFYWMGLFDDPGSFDQIFWPMLLLGFFVGSFIPPLTKLTLHGLSGNLQIRAAEEAASVCKASCSLGVPPFISLIWRIISGGGDSLPLICCKDFLRGWRPLALIKVWSMASSWPLSSSMPPSWR
jgi:DHA2 family multidrug resistance protein